MTFVFDASSLVVLKNFYPDRFPTLWANIDGLVGAGRLVSVREVFHELAAYDDVDFIQEWAKDNKQIFLAPSQAETLFVAKIFRVPHFQNLIAQRSRLNGKPVADPFVIASAWERGGTVVTEESLKPNAAKIPNVCKHFNIRCISLEGFMEEEGWAF